MTRRGSLTPRQANSTKRLHTYVHKRRLADNETNLCGNTNDGSATLIWAEVNCPVCIARRGTEEEEP